MGKAEINVTLGQGTTMRMEVITFDIWTSNTRTTPSSEEICSSYTSAIFVHENSDRGECNLSSAVKKKPEWILLMRTRVVPKGKMRMKVRR